MNSPFISVRCDILSGAFSGERVFEVRTASGEIIDGIAPVRTCTKANGMPIGDNEPSRDERLQGQVAARLITNGGSTALVQFPDGEDAEVAVELIAKRHVEPRHVSV